MLSDVVGYLICPTCCGDLSLDDGALRCEQGHSYDVARQGYVNLLLEKGRTARGDTAGMVDARAQFLARGHFSLLAQSLVEAADRALRPAAAGCIVDVGAGTGYYLAKVLDSMPERVGLALDASKYSARRAARSHGRAGAVVCDAWGRLPVRTGAAALVVNVFAPRSPAELHRVLGTEGRLIVLTPTVAHLESLVKALELLTVDELKEERLKDKFDGHFRLLRRTPIEFSMHLGHDDVQALVDMSPSARHTDRNEIRRRVAGFPEPFVVEASVTFSVYAPRSTTSP